MYDDSKNVEKYPWDTKSNNSDYVLLFNGISKIDFTFRNEKKELFSIFKKKCS
jgi:hypothetical protein